MGNMNNKDKNDAQGNSKIYCNNSVTTISTEHNETHYNMNHKNRGLALIFNHEHFEVEELPRRSGTNKDCDRLVNRLEKLGFIVKVFHDLEYGDLYTHVIAAGKMNHSDNDCFVMVILTHGNLGILYAQDSPYKPENLWTPFLENKCPTLAGKPKIFIIQACQGNKPDPGVTLDNTETDGNGLHSNVMPTHPDFLIVYATFPGYCSWRNPEEGSWFIQALCEELEESSEIHDILTILTFVSRRVAIDYESCVPQDAKYHLQKQIPCITTMLTRLLKLSKKDINDLEINVEAYKSKGKRKSNFATTSNKRITRRFTY